MLCGWEGNRRSGITLAIRYRLSGLSTYGLKEGQCAGDEHPTYAPLEHGPLFYLLTYFVKGLKRFALFFQLRRCGLVGCKRTAGRRLPTTWYWSVLWLPATTHVDECGWRRWRRLSPTHFLHHIVFTPSIARIRRRLPVYFRFVQLLNAFSLNSNVTNYSKILILKTILHSANWFL